MKIIRSAYPVLCMLIVFLSVLLAFNMSLTAEAASDEPQKKYTYSSTTEEFEEDGFISERRVYYVDDIEGGFGEFTKTFSLPSSYKISAEVNSEIMSAVRQIINDNGIDTTYSVYECEVIMVIDGFEHTLSRTYYENDEFENIDLNRNIDSRVLSANGDYEIKGYLCFYIVQAMDVKEIHFNLGSVQMSPIQDGSLICFESIYYWDGLDVSPPYISIFTRSEGEIFSTDPSKSCYIVKSVDSYGLPAEDYTMTFIYDGRASIEGSVYDWGSYDIRKTPYTIQGKLDFKTVDGKEHTLYTNVITVREHYFDMRIDGAKDYRVGAGVEHEYLFILDNNDISDMVIESSTLYLESEGGEHDYHYFPDDNMFITVLAFSGVENKNIVLNARMRFNEGRELIVFQRVNFEVEVLEEEPAVVFPDYEITFDFPENTAVLLGGTEFEVTASINEFYGDEHFVCSFTASGASLGVLRGESNKLVLVPLSAGRSVLYFTAVSETGGEFSESIFIDVVESTAENTLLTFKNDFNLTGSDVVAYFTIDGFSSFLNCSPSWRVQIESGENLVDVPFIVDEYGAAIVESAQKGYYHFSVSGDNIVPVNTVKRVSDVNMAEIAQKYLPYLAPIMVLSIFIAVYIRYKSKMYHTLIFCLTKTSNTINTYLNEIASNRVFSAQLRSIIRSLRKDLALADMIDQETLGQYHNVCETISTAIQICEAVKSNNRKSNSVKTSKFLLILKEQYVDEAIRICSELDNALEKFAAVKVAAATTAPVEKAAPKTDYLKMLKNFYRNGDDEDSNGRSGDSDRNTDTKTEN